MKKIEAYQTTDGKKFLKALDAQDHENRLRYKAKVRDIEDYLATLLGIEILKTGEDREDLESQLSNILMDKGISGLLEDAIELEVIIELIIDVATILDGALLKTAQYAREITSSNQEGE